MKNCKYLVESARITAAYMDVRKRVDEDVNFVKYDEKKPLLHNLLFNPVETIMRMKDKSDDKKEKGAEENSILKELEKNGELHRGDVSKKNESDEGKDINPVTGLPYPDSGEDDCVEDDNVDDDVDDVDETACKKACCGKKCSESDTEDVDFVGDIDTEDVVDDGDGLPTNEEVYAEYKEFLGDKEPVVETKEGVIHFQYDPERNVLAYGGASNTGLLEEGFVEYDKTESMLKNLENLHDEIYDKYGYPEGVDESVVNEGAGAGYTVDIDGLKLGKVLKIETVHPKEGPDFYSFEAEIVPGEYRCSANDYYDSYISDEPVMIDGGKLKGYIDVWDSDVEDEIYIRRELENTTVDISFDYGWGWIHVYLPEDGQMSFDHLRDRSGKHFEINELELDSKELAAAVNSGYKKGFEDEDESEDDVETDDSVDGTTVD